MKKTLKILLITLLLILAGGAALAFWGYHQNKTSAVFISKTTLNGIDIGGRTPESVARTIAEEHPDFAVTITEDGEPGIQGTAKDLGYTFDEEGLLKFLQQAMQDQKVDFLSIYKALIFGDHLSADTSYRFDEGTFTKFVASANLAVPRVASQEAKLELNEKKTEYVIVDAVQGNEIDDAKLQEHVLAEVDKYIENGPTEEGFTTAVPENVYTSEIVSTDTTALEEERKVKNKELKLINTFKKMSVTYTFGSETQVLDAKTITSWISYDENDNFVVDEQKIKDYVSAMAKKYNTLWLPREFKTSGGDTITIDSGKNMYGYQVDQEAECAKLKEEILTAKAVTREPVYLAKNSYGNPYYLAREGTDDLAGTYVEVSISRQHVWVYKGGKLLLESDCVTGKPTDGRATITGVYPIAYKQSPRTLEGGEAGTEYSVKVQYWMAFNMGQGLHDASWRSHFGGSIYKSAGSHGCVNLPKDVAKRIYENMDTGTAVIVYN